MQRWIEPTIVAGTGPSLTAEIADLCRVSMFPCIAINDAYRLMPWADVLYAADLKWWEVHNPEFNGIRMVPRSCAVQTRKDAVKRLRLQVIDGKSADSFSLDQDRIHYGVLGTGAHGGFQAINLAILFGGNPIILVGFDMRAVDNRAHFFGQHPRGLIQRQHFSGWIKNIERAARSLPRHIKIINATPGSALKCFPIMTLTEAIREATNGPETDHPAVELAHYA